MSLVSEATLKFVTPVVGFLILFYANTVQAEPTREWQRFLSEAEASLRYNDASYAFYKLRKAWLAVPSKDLEAAPYQKIRMALADAYEAAADEKPGHDAIRIRSGDLDNDRIDCMFRQREFNSSGEGYSVYLTKDRVIEFTARGLDSTEGEGVCVRVKLTPLQAEQLRQQAIQIRQKWKRKMPIRFAPGSRYYEELLELCQPIKPGERKEMTGFDVSPFMPMDVPRIPDI